MSGDGAKSGGPKKDGDSPKKQSGFWDGLRSFGSALLEGIAGAQPGNVKPSVSRRDPVASRDRPAAARQVHRSMQAWRDRDDQQADAKTGSNDAPATEAKEAEGEDAQAVDESEGATSESNEQASGADTSEEKAAEGDDGAKIPEGEGAEGGEEPAAETPSQSVAAKLKGIHRKVFLSAKPTIFRMASSGVSASRMFGPHDTTKNAIANIKKTWDKTIRKQKLRVGSNEEKAFRERKEKIEKDYNDREAEYQTVKTTPAVATVQAQVTFYAELSERAITLLTQLEDFTRSAEEKSRISDTLIAEIDGSIAAARQRTPDPNAVPVLQLPDFRSQKEELVNAWAGVAPYEAVEKKDGNPLDRVREWKVCADRLKVASDTAVKLSELPNAMERYVTSIKDIIDQNAKEGAEVGTGTSEDAAIQEARTGQQVKNRWHGPKCKMDAAGLRGNIASLEALKGAFPEPAAVAKIDAEIKKAEDRAKGLDRGANAWKDSPHYNLAKFQAASTPTPAAP